MREKYICKRNKLIQPLASVVFQCCYDNYQYQDIYIKVMISENKSKRSEVRLH